MEPRVLAMIRDVKQKAKSLHMSPDVLMLCLMADRWLGIQEKQLEVLERIEKKVLAI